MPTQEERIVMLENGLNHFKTETVKYYGDMAMEFTIVKGLTQDAVIRLGGIRTQVGQLDQRFDTLNEQITGVRQEMADLRAEFTELRTWVDQQIAGVQQEVTGLRTEVSGLKDLLIQVLARLPEKSA